MNHGFKVKAEHRKYRLDFKFDAGTSRGVLRTKDTYFIRVASESFSGVYGYGEAGPLSKLSVDDVPDFGQRLKVICDQLSEVLLPNDEVALLERLETLIPKEFPSIRFGMEVALLDLMHGGKRKILTNSFYDDKNTIAINGLIWTGSRDFMKDQIRQKLEEGYDCIKMKIGSIDFEQEIALLADIRKHYSAQEVTLRVDANGAFSKEEALDKLQQLSEFDLHSIEQPIRQGNWEEMAKLCRETPIPIALDEELIGIDYRKDKMSMLKKIKPQYIILKPTLVGGVFSTREWISLAEEQGIGWWMTSALESNIGLNAVAQLTSTYHPRLPQGLGTGQLYYNNIDSPLTIDKGKISYQQDKSWSDLGSLFGPTT